VGNEQVAATRSARRRENRRGEERFAGWRSAKRVLPGIDARIMHAARSAEADTERPCVSGVGTRSVVGSLARERQTTPQFAPFYIVRRSRLTSAALSAGNQVLDSISTYGERGEADVAS
jgi:hypothetical protein